MAEATIYEYKVRGLGDSAARLGIAGVPEGGQWTATIYATGAQMAEMFERSRRQIVYGRGRAVVPA